MLQFSVGEYLLKTLDYALFQNGNLNEVHPLEEVNYFKRKQFLQSNLSLWEERLALLQAHIQGLI